MCLHVESLIDIYKDTATNPIEALLENEKRVILKCLNNKEGNLVLINEYICYRIADTLKLSIPQCGICIIDDKTIDSNKFITDENYGYCFYSTRIDNATKINSDILNKISFKEFFVDMILFDHLVYNKDRHDGNILLILKQNVRLVLIDHTHVFKNQCIWDKACLNNGIKENDYLDEIIMEYNKETYEKFLECSHIETDLFFNAVNKYKKVVTEKLLMIIINELPNEWINNYSCTHDDLKALVDYLLYRVQHLDDICNMILKYIKGGD